MKKKLFILTLATLTGALLQTATAAPVTFWFSGTVDSINNPSNSLPSGIAIGTPFSGRVTYDPAWVSSATAYSFPAGDTSNSYFTNTAGFSMLVQIGGHTITNALNPIGYNYGYVGIYEQFNNNDSFTVETAHADLMVDGSPTLVGNLIPYMNLSLSDRTKTAYNTAVLPSSPPTIGQFPDQRIFNWQNWVDDDFRTTVFSIAGNITVLTTNELVALNLRRTGNNTLQLGWPTAVSGYTLQSTTNLASGNWQTVTNAVTDLNMEHTVTFSTASKNQFFRLKK